MSAHGEDVSATACAPAQKYIISKKVWEHRNQSEKKVILSFLIQKFGHDAKALALRTSLMSRRPISTGGLRGSTSMITS